MENYKIINNEQPKENYRERGKIIDIVVELQNKIINIEMNKKYYEKIIKRNNTYVYKINSLNEDKIVIQINIDDYNLYDNKTSIIKFSMMSDMGIENKTFITKYHANLEVIYKKYYNKEKLTRLEKILLMLKLNKREELINLSRGDELMERMYEELNKMSEDKENLLSYSKEELEKEAYQIEAREIGLKEGLKEGLEKGIQHNKLEISKNLLAMNMKVEDISKATGLSIVEIESLK